MSNELLNKKVRAPHGHSRVQSLNNQMYNLNIGKENSKPSNIIYHGRKYSYY